MPLTLVPRAGWRARYADGFGPAPLPAQEVWLHHTAGLTPDLDWADLDRDGVDDSEAAAVRQVELIGQQRFGGGISYTFLAAPAGRCYHGHSVGRRGAHTAKRNSIARAICLLGNYDVRPVTAAQVEAVAQLLVHGKRHGWWVRARLSGGHRQAPGASTACPGRYGMAAIPVINARAAALEAGASPATFPTAEEIVMSGDLFVGRHPITKEVRAGNGLHSVHVRDPQHYADLVYIRESLGQKIDEKASTGAVPMPRTLDKVQDVANLIALGEGLPAGEEAARRNDVGHARDQVRADLAAVNAAVGSAGDVDEAKLAEHLAPVLVPPVVEALAARGGVTAEEVQQAVEDVLARVTVGVTPPATGS